MKDVINKTKSHWRDIALALTAVFVIGSFAMIAYGISQNNKLATQNKAIAAQNQKLAAEATNHINCIIKLSETPLGNGDRAKYIDNFNNTCQIRFVK